MAQTLIVRLLPANRAEWLDNKAVQQGDLALLAQQAAGKRIVLAYPGERVHCLGLQAPARRQAAWLKALPYALEDQTAQDIAALHIVTGPIADNGATPLMLTDRHALAGTLAELQSNGIDPTAVVPDFLLLPWHPGQWTVWQDGERMVVRLDEYTGFVCERDNLPLCLQKALADAPEPPDSVRVIGELDDLSEIDGLRLETEPTQALFSVARAAPPPINLQFNLRKGEFARNKASQLWWRQWRAAAILAGLSITLALVQNLWQWQQLEAEKTRLQAAIEQTFRSVMPTARLVNPRAQLEAQLRQIEQNDPAAGNHFLPLLGIAARALQEYSALQLRGFNFRQGLLELDLTGGSLEQLDTLKAQFAQIPELHAEIKASVREGQVLSRLGLQFSQRIRSGDS